MAYSPYTKRIVEYVQQHPGCCKFDVARICRRNARTGPSKLYYLVNTAIRNGHIVAQYKGGRYYLYTPNQLNRL